ncbi:hypothetical protein I79_003392 [Cricetulus griseus]|uniref:Uncharacterized protein n=1 Tax=Cricetulus griseus TaxID=10029 RepID=G3GZU5_CRIGR|nr:hypothetical protein I79_003392 [Cricetulus griseus]
MMGKVLLCMCLSYWMINKVLVGLKDPCGGTFIEGDPYPGISETTNLDANCKRLYWRHGYLGRLSFCEAKRAEPRERGPYIAKSAREKQGFYWIIQMRRSTEIFPLVNVNEALHSVIQMRRSTESFLLDGSSEAQSHSRPAYSQGLVSGTTDSIPPSASRWLTLGARALGRSVPGVRQRGKWRWGGWGSGRRRSEASAARAPSAADRRRRQT